MREVQSVELDVLQFERYNDARGRGGIVVQGRAPRWRQVLLSVLV